MTIVRVGGLGDTILVLPTFEVLRAAHPDATFTLVGSAWVEALRSLLPVALRAIHVDRVFPPPRHGGHAANLFASSDAVVVYTATPESDLVAHVRQTCPGPVVLWSVTPGAGFHAARHLAGAAASEPGRLDAVPTPILQCPHRLRLQGRDWLDRQFGRGVRPAAVHPGSGGKPKCWPPSRFADLAARLGAPILLVEGPADGDACRRVSDLLAPSVAVVRAAGVSLPRLAALLAESRGYIGNDSGVSHLAAALGVPAVVVFGPTDPAVWAPLGPRVHAVPPGGGGLWPTVDEVLVAARRVLGGGQPGIEA